MERSYAEGEQFFFAMRLMSRRNESGLGHFGLFCDIESHNKKGEHKVRPLHA